jgi:hypothetical protein
MKNETGQVRDNRLALFGCLGGPKTSARPRARSGRAAAPRLNRAGPRASRARADRWEKGHKARREKDS